jgi:ABC-type phosphate transport system substrate-binding protein
MSQWSKQYNTLYPNVAVNYQSIGSGGGIQPASSTR